MTKKLKLLGISLGLALTTFTLWDLYGPREVDLRQFDPAAVARLESEAWKAYYEGNQSRLFGYVGEMLREQFHFPRLRAFANAYRAARAAMVFKETTSPIEALKALPYLRKYFQVLCGMSKVPCRAELVAQKELGWWMKHREHTTGLAQAVAAAAAELYVVSVDKTMPYAEKRVQAMQLRDANPGAPDWAKIEETLVESYRLLYSALNRS